MHQGVQLSENPPCLMVYLTADHEKYICNIELVQAVHISGEIKAITGVGTASTYTQIDR